MKMRSVLAFVLVVVLMMSLCTPAMAANTKGVTFTATLNNSTLNVSNEDQVVTVTVNASKEITWDGIGFKAFYDSPLKLTNITNKEVTLTAGDIQVSLGSGDNGAGYQTADGENSTITNICVLHFTVPANTPAGTYNLGVQKLEITSDYGDIWENSATAMTTLTIEETVAPGPVAYTATASKSEFDVSAEDQTLTVTVNANQQITWDGIGFKAFYDSPLKLTNITNKEVTLTAGDIQVSLGSGDNGAGYQTADGENSTITNICVLHFTIPANTPAGTYNLGIQKLEITKDYGDIWEANATAMTAIEIKGAAHTCSGTKQTGKAATCTVDGWNDYYSCTCGKNYTDAACTNEIADLAAWKTGAGKIAASHDYGTLVEEDPGKHTATEVKDGMKAHYFCDTCDTYFDSSKVATTKEALTIKKEHNYTAQYGYKEDDGHANVCACGAHDTVVAHTPNIPAPTETQDQKCSICDYVIAPKINHIHQNNLTPVVMQGATCTDDGYKAYYTCSCGKNFEDATASIEIENLTEWKAGAGKITASGHTYTEEVKDAAHLKSEATKCTEYDVYWFDCADCDANAKNDAEAADKFWTSTDAGEHNFTEQIADDAHFVAGTGANCQAAKEYYYDCADCAEIGTTTWESNTKGDHSFTQQIADEAHLVAGTGANCQDAKEYYYDCAYCAEIGTNTWASTEMGEHEFDTTAWGYKDKATGHAHKCKFCNEHDQVQAHIPGAAATEDDDQICTACLIVLEPATGHLCQNHLTYVGATGESCTVDGNKAYYECSCGKYYEDASASVEITDKTSVVIPAAHNYGELIDETPATHTATVLAAGKKAHYYCDKCDTYFTEGKVATTESDLIIPAPTHSYTTQYGYKGADGHADTCSCGAKNTVVAHTPDREEATEDNAIKCSACGYEIAPKLEHVHDHGNEWKSDKKNHWNECRCGDKANVAKHADADGDNFCDVCQRDVTPAVTPETGDNVMVIIACLLVSALGMVAVIAKKKYFVK